MPGALAPRTASQANYVSHAQLQIAVGKQGYDKIVATCASHASAARKLQRAVRHHLARRARRLRLRDGLRRHIHAARIATIRSRAATMRAVDPNIDHSAPVIRGGIRGDSIDGTVQRIEKAPLTPFMFPTGRGTVDAFGDGLLIMPETPRPLLSCVPLSAVLEEKPSSLALANRFKLSVESAGFSDTPGSRASTGTLATPQPLPSSRPASSRVAGLVAGVSIPAFQRRCTGRNAWIAFVEDLKPAVKVMLPEIEAPQSATKVSARRAGRPHITQRPGLACVHAPHLHRHIGVLRGGRRDAEPGRAARHQPPRARAHGRLEPLPRRARCPRDRRADASAALARGLAAVGVHRGGEAPPPVGHRSA